MSTPDANIPHHEPGLNNPVDPKPNDKQAKIRFNRPFFVAVYQTEARTFTKPFFGKNAERDAKAFATDRAMNHNTTVAILGPQTDVLAPPKPSEPESVKLS